MFSKSVVLCLIATLVISSLYAEVNGKLLFCKHCRTTTANPTEHASMSNNTDKGHIFNAPLKCKQGLSLDNKGKCRRIIFQN
jgi:hypothetical protein